MASVISYELNDIPNIYKQIFDLDERNSEEIKQIYFLPVLFKQRTTRNYFWAIAVDDSKTIKKWGYQDGKYQTSSKNYTGKGKVSAQEQAQQEAIKFWNKQLNKDYQIFSLDEQEQIHFESKDLIKSKTKTSDKTKELLEQFAVQGISFLNQLSETQISAMVMLAKERYYNSEEIISDNLYDILENYLKKISPDHPVLQQVGAPVGKNKVQLPYYMGSMDKIKADTNALSNWLKKYPGPVVISAKLDGISVLYSTEQKTARLYTRGKATVGLDISHMIPYLQLPQEQSVTIRGELIISKELFEQKYSNKYKSDRNFVAGVIGASFKHWEISKWRDLDFVAYEVIRPQLKSSDQLNWLKQRNVLTVWHQLSDEISNEQLSEILTDLRSSYEYEVDGLVVYSDQIYERANENPKHAFAFKMVLSDQLAESNVVDVIWAASKDGYLKPRVQIEPVYIKGSTINFATGHNAKFIFEQGIGPGARVLIVKSGDVIPKVEAVVEPVAPKMPSEDWMWNETKVEAVLRDISSNPEVKSKEISAFVRKMEIPFLGPGTVKKLVAAGFDSIPKILILTEEDILGLEGLGQKSAQKIIVGIKEGLAEADLVTLMGSVNLFGRGMGIKRIRVILDSYPDILTSPESLTEKTEKISELSGFASKTAGLFVQNINKFMNFLQKTNLMYKLEQNKLTEQKDEKTVNNPLLGLKIVLTGFRDKKLEKQIKNLGATVSSSVTKSVDLVVAKDETTDTSKTKKANQYGIAIVEKDQFLQQYDLE